jgi:ribosome-associated protein
MTARRTAPDRRLTPHELARHAAHFAADKKGQDPVILDLRAFDYVCDWTVVTAGESEPQVKAIAVRIEQGLRELGEEPWHVEGLTERQWVLLDYVDVVIHVFHEKARETYLLERLWGDAPRETLDARQDGP